MKKPLLEKYVDDKLVQITSLGDIRQFVICDNIIKGYGKDGYDIKLEFDTYKSACEGMKIIRSKIAQDLQWEKEFEEKLNVSWKWNNPVVSISGDIKEGLHLPDLIYKYLGYGNKVKIKCKDGCIQIERIDK